MTNTKMLPLPFLLLLLLGVGGGPQGAEAGVAYLTDVDLSVGGVSSLIALPGGLNSKDAIISPCTGIMVNRGTAASPWTTAYRIPPEAGATVAEIVSGDALFTTAATAGITFDGQYMVVINGATIARFTVDAEANSILALDAGLTLPTDGSLGTPLFFPSEACTTCTASSRIGYTYGTDTPLLMSRNTAWALYVTEAGDLAIGGKVLNVNGNSPTCTVPSPPHGTNPIGWSLATQTTPAHYVCVKDIMYAARKVNQVDTSYDMFIQMSGMPYVYHIVGDISTVDDASIDRSIRSIQIVAKLFAPTPGYDVVRTTAVHTCSYYIWPDHLTTDIFALDVTFASTTPFGMPFRIKAVAGSQQPWRSVFGNDGKLYATSEDATTVTRIDGNALVARLNTAAEAGILYENGCLASNNGCNPLFHTCTPGPYGDPVCRCPSALQDATPTGCVDLNECAHGLHNCGSDGTKVCVNENGMTSDVGFHCDCAPNHNPNGNGGCVLEPPCANDPSACVAPTVCNPTAASVAESCVCQIGWTRTEGRCVPPLTSVFTGSDGAITTVAPIGDTLAVSIDVSSAASGGATALTLTLPGGTTPVLLVSFAAAAGTVALPLIISGSATTVIISGGTFVMSGTSTFLTTTASTVVLDGAHVTLGSSAVQVIPSGVSFALTNGASFTGQLEFAP